MGYTSNILILLVDRRPVYIDKDMEEAVKEYLKLEKENVNTFEVALSNKDFHTVSLLGDQLLERGGSFGFPYIVFPDEMWIKNLVLFNS